jgi:hypothetical protein
MRGRICGTVFTCADCSALLAVKSDGSGLALGGCDYQPDWFMVKDRVWQHGQRGGKCRFLCVGCLERPIGRKLSADDFRRSARVNFDPKKSSKLRRRMRGLKPAKHLVNTTFTP